MHSYILDDLKKTLWVIFEKNDNVILTTIAPVSIRKSENTDSNGISSQCNKLRKKKKY